MEPNPDALDDHVIETKEVLPIPLSIGVSSRSYFYTSLVKVP